MLIWKDLAYYHMPKTGGNTILHALKVGERNEVYIGSTSTEWGKQNITNTLSIPPANHHATLEEMWAMMRLSGMDPLQYYFYTSLRHSCDRWISEWNHKMSLTAWKDRYIGVNEYISKRIGKVTAWEKLKVGGKVPSNLTIVQYEEFHLWESILRDQWEIPNPVIGKLNAFPHDIWNKILTRHTVDSIIDDELEMITLYYPELLD